MPTDAEREPATVMWECAEYLALVSTRRLYAAQPELWARGEEGRAHVLADFGHHFRALAALDEGGFAAHVAWCRDLWARRGFPSRWLDDAWATMRSVLADELPDGVARAARAVLDAVTATG